MADLTITATDTEITNALTAALRLDRLRNPQPLYKAWANYLERLVVQAYKTETAPFGSGWPALQPATLKRKRRATILRESGQMYDTTVAQVLPDGVRVGSNQAVGRYSLLAIHQFGAPRRGIPARRVLPMDTSGNVLPQVTEELIALTDDYLTS